MRKFISAVILGTALLALGGCGNSKTGDSAPEATTQTAAEETSQVQPIELNAEEYITLGEYKGLTVEKASVEVTDEEVNEQVDLLAQDYAEYKEITDRDTVQENDYINMDYTCTIDGKKSEDYSETDVDTQIGSQEYSVEGAYDFDAEVTGAKVGDTVTINFTFPEDYDDAEVAGKDCVMEVKINKLEEEILPEITDAFIKENTDCDTVEEYREQTRKELEDSYNSEADQTVQDDLWNMVLENCTQKKDFPQDIVDQEVQNLTIENEEWAGYFGMEVADFIQEYYGISMEDYAKQTLVSQCVQELLVEQEGITVSDEEYDAEIQSFIDDYGYEDEAEIMEYYTEDEIRSDLLYSKLMTTLLGYSNIVEAGDAASGTETDTAQEDTATEAATVQE